MPKLVYLFIYLFNVTLFQAVLLLSHVLNVWIATKLQTSTVNGAPRQRRRHTCQIMNTYDIH